MAEFQLFQLERIMSEWENVVDYNLSESGAHPVVLGELLHDGLTIDDLLATALSYPQVDGSLELRQRIAALYPGAQPDNVLVTSGAAQANFTTIWTLLKPGDEIVVLMPNYLQIWGIAHNFGLNVKECHLREELNWAVDLDDLCPFGKPV